MPPLLRAAIAAASLGTDTKRRSVIGCVAVREDGAIVQARNGSVQHPMHDCHAEVRCLRKSGLRPRIFVARVHKNGLAAMARPCAKCMSLLRSKRVVSVTYTTGGSGWAVERP